MDKALNKDGSGDFDLVKEFLASRKVYVSYSAYCPSSHQFSFKGNTYTFDLSIVCQLGMAIKIFVHIAAYLLAFRIFARVGS